MVFCIHNSDFSTRIASLYGSQPSSLVLCIQKSDFGIRIVILYRSHPSFVVFACKKRLLDQNYKSLWVPALICCFCKQNSNFRTRINSLYASQTSHIVLCMQNNVITTWITSLHGSQTSLGVLCMQKNVISIRITSLHGSQPSSVVFACKTATLASETLVSMGPSTHLLFLHTKQRL